MNNVKYASLSNYQEGKNICLLINFDKIFSAKFLSQELQNFINKALIKGDFFKGHYGEIKILPNINNNSIFYVILVGIGDEKELTKIKLEKLGSKLVNKVNKEKIEELTLLIPGRIANLNVATISSIFAFGISVQNYHFDEYMSRKKEGYLKDLIIANDETEETKKAFEHKKAIIEGIFLAKKCGNTPPNKLHPESYSKLIRNELSPLGIGIKILGKQEMEDLGMGALLGVNCGSQYQPQLVIMQYNNGFSNERPVAFVGKGVTFDSGGYSLKPSSSMESMKFDMAGSAALVGLFKTLALRKAKVNAVAVVGLVENMVDAKSQRPGDIVTTMSGKTVEILNTDAEGRLVLADALWYTQKEFQPQIIVNLATLTGAVLISLGHTYAGCFSNNDNLANQLCEAGEQVEEKLWRMPLHDDYKKMLKSDYADLSNIGNIRGVAGSCTAASFLEEFVNKVKWAHLDIAGVGFNNRGVEFAKKGASGYGVKLLDKFIENNYESL